jgi:Tfp pilus assembly protein PilN
MTRINLLPPDERAKAAREQGLALVVLGLVALVLVLGGVYLISYRQASDKQDKVDAKQAEIDQANLQLAELQPYEDLQQGRDEIQDMSYQIYESRVLWSSILEEISLVIPDTVCLTQMTCTVPDAMLAGSSLSGTAQAGTSSEPGVIFAGNAADNTQIAQFMTRLGLLPQLYNIRLVQSTRDQDGDFYVFEVDADLRPFLVAPPMSPTSDTGTAETTTTEGEQP